MTSTLVEEQRASALGARRAGQMRQGHQTRDDQRTARIALLGCGTVGSEVARTLLAQRGAIRARTGVDLVLEKVLVRDAQRERGLPTKLFTESVEEVLAEKPDVVIEVLGGRGTARALVERVLRAGVPVATANKTLIAHDGPALKRIAQEHGAWLRTEACVCSAVPVVEVLQRLRGERVLGLQGVVNGSCNAILEAMSTRGVSLAQAVKEAQALGLVEPDPAADVSGRDSAEKLVILSRLAGVSRQTAREVSPGDVLTTGIEAVTAQDHATARRRGHVIRLVATYQPTCGDAMLVVEPTWLPRDHALARLEGAMNGVVVETDLSGALFLSGPGAGPQPTAGALLGDVLRGVAGEVAAHFGEGHAHDPAHPHEPTAERPAGTAARWYLRITGGVGRALLGEVVATLKRLDVAYEELQSTADGLFILTRPVTQQSVERVRAGLLEAGVEARAAAGPIVVVTMRVLDG